MRDLRQENDPGGCAGAVFPRSFGLPQARRNWLALVALMLAALLAGLAGLAALLLAGLRRIGAGLLLVLVATRVLRILAAMLRILRILRIHENAPWMAPLRKRFWGYFVPNCACEYRK